LNYTSTTLGYEVEEKLHPAVREEERLKTRDKESECTDNFIFDIGTGWE
jgi:hypothetical protein